jgi:CRP-like cAMP-binding protein
VTLDTDVAGLARTRPFSLLPREAVQLIAFAGEKRRLKAGDALFQAGDEADAGYFIHTGAFVLTPNTRGTATPRMARAGALIGENALYAPVTRQVDARATENSVVIRITRETFRRVLTEFPTAANAIRAELAERTRRLVEGLDDARARSFSDAPGAGEPR